MIKTPTFYFDATSDRELNRARSFAWAHAKDAELMGRFASPISARDSAISGETANLIRDLCEETIRQQTLIARQRGRIEKLAGELGEIFAAEIDNANP